MTPEANVSQQLQPYLPGMENLEPAPEKQPHEMTPTEFANHPYAVFHSTHLDEPDLFNPEKRFGKSPVVHFGTLQSALDRHAVTENPANRGIEGQEVDPRTHRTDARLHVFWHKPASLEVGYDSTMNDYTPGTRYYRNLHEDPNSISLATSERGSIKSQHEYVAEAIAQGKANEVHPATMDMYKRGLLKKGSPLPVSHTREYTMTPTRAADIENHPTLPIPKDDPSFHAIGHEGEHIGWYLPASLPTREYAPNIGPNLNRLKEQLEKDSKE
jgi:hypothetical protein